ncbi:unnamed protein product [Lepeophtheirus salmonis]|uniref:(salmon louse) hypothetical protein n=1 Tax=Lepeophtheirus salmonis TaxID=72036 RepID=A0A7R8CM80_LEPSM|nr:unnamed protein product [Lepeophtheirus salmonis]CAF2819132.1 unnamed protein product [Lepeophtheirus salmonis]
MSSRENLKANKLLELREICENHQLCKTEDTISEYRLFTLFFNVLDKMSSLKGNLKDSSLPSSITPPTCKGKEEYTKALRSYEELGFRYAAHKELREFCNSPQYFIPHHPVIREDKSTLKVRPVFNASFPDSSGISLNDCVLNGPRLHIDVSQILLCFRSNKIWIMAHIKKMFCHTKINREDYRFQQYLWRDNNLHVELQVLIMTFVMFGVKSSPFLLMSSI